MATFSDLVQLIERLRAPGGCPWDREQTYATLAPMLLEEAYETFDAIEDARAGNSEGLRDELGDLLFQILFFSRVAEELGEFTINDVISAVHAKMVRRHPHVFGGLKLADVTEVLRNWEAIKATEKEESKAKRVASGGTKTGSSLLDGVSSKAPALMEAYQLSTKAARVGFDWKEVDDLFVKLEEEMRELRQAIDQNDQTEAGAEAIREEVGDLLFICTNIARRLNIEPEAALKLASRKFRKRFAYLEHRLAENGRTLSEASLDEMEELWQRAKLLMTSPGKLSLAPEE